MAMTKTKRCDGCVHFLKVKNFKGSSGLCTYHDSRCDGGFHCYKWKAPKYKRTKKERLC